MLVKKILTYLNPYIIVLIVLEIALFVANIVTGTYLVGWDNVMPELNFPLNFERSLFSIWQEYRGLGLMDGMAHSANLFHTLYLYLLSFLFPDELLRYLFIHITHLAGGIGFFFLGRFLTKKSSAAFLGSLFYMLNIGVIQMYFAPLEVFAVHFAALPWLALTITKALGQPTRKNLFFLFLISLLTTPQAFVPTVFIAFSVLAGFLLLFHFLHIKKIKPVLLIGLILFLANAFWALPYSASALKTPEIIQSTRINQYASDEIYYRNQAHGNLIDVLGLNGFMLSTIEYDHRQESDVFFMEAWRNHQTSPFYIGIYILCLSIIILGLGKIIRERTEMTLPYIAAGGIAFIFLANNTPGFEQLNTLIRTVVPLIGEAFRFPFTKFITLFAFCLSVFFIFGIQLILPRIKIAPLIVVPVTSLLLLFLALPAFQGNFTSPLLKLAIPQDYFSLIDHLNTKPSDRRIAVLPAHTFWNWHYRTWGHRGSGFLWHGIEQPMLERAFDPWSLENEQYYNELSHALNNQNGEQLERVIAKYDLSYLLLDQYVVNTLSTQPINYDSVTRFLATQDYITKDKTFGRLILYRVTTEKGFITSVSTDEELTNTSLGEFFREDVAFSKQGTYLTNPDEPYDVYYPFSSLFTEKLQSDLVFTVRENSDSFTLDTTLAEPITLTQDATITLPSLFEHEFLIPVSITVEENFIVLTPLYPSLTVNGLNVERATTPISIPYTGEIPRHITFEDIDHTVDLTNPSARSYLLANYPNSLTLEGATPREIQFDSSAISRNGDEIKLPTNEIRSVQVTLPKIQSPLSVANILTTDDYTIQEDIEQLHPFLEEKGSSQAQEDNDGITLSAESSSVQLVFYRNNLFHKASYLLLADTEYISGLPINFYVDNPFEKRAEMEAVLAQNDTLNALVLPKTQEYFQGYGFHFTVKSVGTEEATSRLKRISLYPFPHQTLKNITIRSRSAELERNNSLDQPLSFKHPHPALYYGEAEKLTQGDVLTLSQSYDAGWRAYAVDDATWFSRYLPFLRGEELTTHVRVNNWKNGWILNDQRLTDNDQIVIVYLPQYLHYIGLILPFMILPFFLLRKNAFRLRRNA